MKTVTALLLATAIGSVAAAQVPAGGSAPANFDQLVRARIEATFRDPDSAKVTMTRPPRWAAFDDAAFNRVEGWAACYRINGKNGYGGFSGPQQFVFVVAGDRVIFDEAMTGRSHYRDKVVLDECSKPASPPAPAASATNPKVSL